MAGKKQFQEKRSQIYARLDPRQKVLVELAATRAGLSLNEAALQGLNLFIGWAFSDDSQKKVMDAMFKSGSLKAERAYQVLHEQADAPKEEAKRSAVPRTTRK